MKKIIKLDGCSGLCPYRLYVHYQFSSVDRCMFYDMEVDNEKFPRRESETIQNNFPEFCQIRKITIEGG